MAGEDGAGAAHSNPERPSTVVHRCCGLGLGLGQGRETLRITRTTGSDAHPGVAAERYADTVTQDSTPVADDIADLHRQRRAEPASDGGTDPGRDQEEESCGNTEMVGAAMRPRRSIKSN